MLIYPLLVVRHRQCGSEAHCNAYTVNGGYPRSYIHYA